MLERGRCLYPYDEGLANRVATAGGTIVDNGLWITSCGGGDGGGGGCKARIVSWVEKTILTQQARPCEYEAI